MIEKAKENSRANYGRRLIRELNNNSNRYMEYKYKEKTKLYFIND